MRENEDEAVEGEVKGGGSGEVEQPDNRGR